MNSPSFRRMANTPSERRDTKLPSHRRDATLLRNADTDDADWLEGRHDKPDHLDQCEKYVPLFSFRKFTDSILPTVNRELRINSRRTADAAGGSMKAHLALVASASSQRFAFDYNRNVVLFQSKVIHLSPHEADILHLLLENRSRVISLTTLIQRVYGVLEPDTAAVSIRVAVHSLRKKLAITGITIKAQARVGYEIHVEEVPDLDLGLSDIILSAFNVAQSSGAPEIAGRLQAMLSELAALKFSKAVANE